MMFWAFLISWLVWLSAVPAAIELERPKAAAAVAAARASLLSGGPLPTPAPTECACGGTCVGGVWKPDGKIEQPCPCPDSCDCKTSSVIVVPGNCPDGSCDLP